ncbi:MAG: hypothetical protein HY954_08940 [Deltaproteobacteria bacterium]|nr:hypothetical protein [Deltaproteobacteria bacterium]
MKDFEKILLNAIIYSYGRVLAQYPLSELTTISKEVGRNMISYLKDLGVEFKAGRTVDETVANVINAFVEQGFVEDITINPSTEKGMYCKWVKLVGLDAYDRLYRETGSAFISCPLLMVTMAIIAPLGYRVKVHDVKFDMENRVVETWEELVKDSKEAEVEPLNEKEKDITLQLEREIEIRKKAKKEIKSQLTDIKRLNDVMAGSDLRMKALRKEIHDLKAEINKLKAAA